MPNQKVVYFICTDENRMGIVSRKVWNILEQKGNLTESEMVFDGKKVLTWQDENGNQFYFAQSELPVCCDYPRYLGEMNALFSDCDFSGMVTRHEGAGAPPKVLTVHSLGDVNSGVYGKSSPRHMRNLLRAYERNRVRLGLEDFQVVTEATHWSGMAYGAPSAETLLEFPVPMVDIEVGSEPASWNNETACQALADTLFEVFNDDGRQVKNLLCVGGIHFDPNFAQAVFTDWNDCSFGVTHIIANQWLVTGEYEGKNGLEFASRAVEAIDGDIDAIAFHDKMKGWYKDLVRALGKKYDVPILKHQRLRTPETIEWN